MCIYIYDTRAHTDTKKTTTKSGCRGTNLEAFPGALGRSATRCLAEMESGDMEVFWCDNVHDVHGCPWCIMVLWCDMKSHPCHDSHDTMMLLEIIWDTTRRHAKLRVDMPKCARRHAKLRPSTCQNDPRPSTCQNASVDMPKSARRHAKMRPSTCQKRRFLDCEGFLDSFLAC